MRDVRVTQRFGARPQYYAQFGFPDGHEGCDFGGESGDFIFACADGIVKVIAPDDGQHPYGNQIRLVHNFEGQEYETIYAHLARFVGTLRVGHLVKAGELVAYMGTTGNSSGVHLHLTCKKRGATARREIQTTWDGRQAVFPRDVINPEPLFVDE